MIVMLAVELMIHKKRYRILQLDDPMLIIMHRMRLCVEELGIDICIVETGYIRPRRYRLQQLV